MGWLILDLDGPILDSSRRHHEAYQRILRQHGRRPLDQAGYWQTKRAGTSAAEILRQTDDLDILEAFQEQWLRTIESEELLQFDRVQVAALERLDQWKAEGFRLSLVTLRSSEEAARLQLMRTGVLLRLDDLAIVPHSAGFDGKREAVLKWQRDLRSTPSLWIGDSEVDYKAARSLGIRVVLLANGVRDRDFLDRFSQCYVEESIETLNLEAMCP